MSLRENNLKEIEDLFGKPEDGITGFSVNGTHDRILDSDFLDTGYKIEGIFENIIINPQGKEIATIDSGITQFIYVGKNKTNYHLGGTFGEDIEYLPKKKS